ncbi:MAG: HobA family DNA replication regulator [Sulfurospirillaceae bacterium]|jgi:hypothetical protein|nr:HobA family DNA replication regulator [Sulfurospirillaceae bacterium]MDY0238614.1 HobA family DNA replication regulator [Campylobacterales bacterium]NLM99469.1 hypothetical protein [Campylobacteraceae bacterium]
MQAFLKWTLEAIRKEGSWMSWMEEKRLEWVPLAASRLQSILQGHVFLVLTDKDREWFEKYIISSINKNAGNRPLLPFVSLKTFYPSLDEVRSREDIEILEDLLSISFPHGYTIFYIGKSNDFKSQIAKSKNDSFMWLLDEQMQNSFYLSSADELLDIKLIQLYKLMEKTIDALLFAQISIENE